jgi:hypothetical protein
MVATVWSFAVGPIELVPRVNVAIRWLDGWRIVVGSTAVPGIPEVVRAFIAGDATALTSD